MKLQSSRIMMFVLIGVLFLSISSVYAETAEEYFQRGLANDNQGNYDQAISDYTKAIEIDPNLPGVYFNRGSIYDNQGNLPQAISDYTKAIEIDPNYVSAYYDRANVYYKLKEYDLAWVDVHKAESLGYKADKEGLAFLEKLKKASGRDK